jgi:hypothetical protein
VPAPCLDANQFLHFVQVAPVTGREVVQPDHRLADPQQRFDQVRADEAGTAGHQPARRALPQALVERRQRRSSQ